MSSIYLFLLSTIKIIRNTSPIQEETVNIINAEVIFFTKGKKKAIPEANARLNIVEIDTPYYGRMSAI